MGKLNRKRTKLQSARKMHTDTESAAKHREA
jgi:hypothetical protein